MMLKLLFMIIITVAYDYASGLQKNTLDNPPVVCAPAGCMRGKIMSGYWSHSFEAYLGVPYAFPPTTYLRFRDPRLYPPWSHVKNFTVPKSDCMQKDYLRVERERIITGSEDCLYLNVYVPRGHRYTKRLLPVMVYIHGGEFYSGSVHPNVSGPEYIMDTQQVILVTFNYRLGVLGFLSTNDMNMSGNYGLKDQLMALRWVQINIRFFGGNPQRVTIFGHGAGAVSAHMLMLSQRSENLFHAVIALSGTVNVPWAIDKNPLQTAMRTADLCDIKHYTNTSVLADGLRLIDAHTLIHAGDVFRSMEIEIDPVAIYRPIVDAFNYVSGILADHPEAIMMDDNYIHRPLLLGSVPNEAAMRVVAIMESNYLRNSFNSKFRDLLQRYLELPDNFPSNERMQYIIKEYFGNERQLDIQRTNTKQGFIDLLTDRHYHHPIYNIMKTYLHYYDDDDNPVYLYVFNYTGKDTFAKLYNGLRDNQPTKLDYGVVHGDDLIYLFRNDLFGPYDKESQYATAIKTFVDNVVSFSKYMKPSIWSDTSPKKCTYHILLNTPETTCEYQKFENGPNEYSKFLIAKVSDKFNAKRMQFWDSMLA